MRKLCQQRLLHLNSGNEKLHPKNSQNFGPYQLTRQQKQFNVRRSEYHMIRCALSTEDTEPNSKHYDTITSTRCTILPQYSPKLNHAWETHVDKYMSWRKTLSNFIRYVRNPMLSKRSQISFTKQGFRGNFIATMHG